MAANKVENPAAKGSLEEELIGAIKKGDLKGVETLIAAGAGLDARDSNNMTGLMIAAKEGYIDIANRLINAGADINVGGRYDGFTALFHAVEGDHVEIAQLLLADGAAKNEEKNTLRDLFVSSVYKGNTQMVKMLLTADVSINSDTLETAYMLALNFRHTEIVKVIRAAKDHLKSQRQ